MNIIFIVVVVMGLGGFILYDDSNLIFEIKDFIDYVKTFIGKFING
jgi:hypothetical protein